MCSALLAIAQSFIGGKRLRRIWEKLTLCLPDFLTGRLAQFSKVASREVAALHHGYKESELFTNCYELCASFEGPDRERIDL